MKNVYKILMHILCAFGCVYQMYNLNVIYFSYETTTNVRYETQTDTYLPAITICYQKWFQNDYLAKLNGDISLFIKNIDNLTISEQFQLFGNSPSKLIHCETSDINEKKVSCDQVANYVQYIDHNWYCFTIFPQLNGEPEKNYLVSKSYLYLLYLRLNKSDPGENAFFLLLHSRDKLIYQNELRKSMSVELTNINSGVITYNVVMIKYMFDPYGGCFVGQTRDECISKCIVNGVIEKTGTLQIIWQMIVILIWYSSIRSWLI